MKKTIQWLAQGALTAALTACGSGGGGESCPDSSLYITHNGINYCTVTSPYTNKVWLDRNLGASQVCADSNDTACYGDYYQWGRNADGHEKSDNNTTTDTLADNVNIVGHSNFIKNSAAPNDWASVDSSGATRKANWSKTDGSFVCPVGFRVPTIDELKAELFDAGSAEINGTSPSIDGRVNAFSSFLKLPSAGGRLYDSGSLYGQGSWGVVWASSVVGSSAHSVYFVSVGAGWYYDYRAYALSVRCLRD